jgi:hypothetical protein
MLRLVGERLRERGRGADGQHLDFFVFIRGAFTRRADAFQEHEMAPIGLNRGVWRAGAEQWLSCHAINPAVTAVNAQQLQINAGALAGVRKGDELLVANPARFPKELMSKEGAPQTLLAQVQSVSTYNAQLVVLAGPAQAAQADWRAWPTDTLVKEPKVAPTAQNTSATAKRSIKTAANASFVMNPY